MSAVGSTRRQASERYARAAQASAPVRTRLWVLRDELTRTRTPRDAARLLTILAEGIHEGFFVGAKYQIRGGWLSIGLELNAPPWKVRLEKGLAT